MKNLQEMENELVTMMDKEGYQIDGYDFSDAVEYAVNYRDNLGNKGIVSITIEEGNDKYMVETYKNNDDDARNQREIKTVKAVRNYIEKYVNC